MENIDIEKKRLEISEKKASARQALAEKIKEEKETRKTIVNNLKTNNLVINIYVGRSNIPHLFEENCQKESKYTMIERSKVPCFCKKRTVVGIQVPGSKEGTTKMLIGYSVWNPDDNYSAQIGFQEAVINVLGKHKVDYVLDNLPTEYNKEVFFKLADMILEKEEVYEFKQ